MMITYYNEARNVYLHPKIILTGIRVISVQIIYKKLKKT